MVFRNFISIRNAITIRVGIIRVRLAVKLFVNIRQPVTIAVRAERIAFGRHCDIVVADVHGRIGLLGLIRLRCEVIKAEVVCRGAAVVDERTIGGFVKPSQQSCLPVEIGDDDIICPLHRQTGRIRAESIVVAIQDVGIATGGIVHGERGLVEGAILDPYRVS